MASMLRQHWAHILLGALTLGLFVGILASVSVSQNRSVTFYYADASAAWLAGTTMYEETGRGFLYLPHAALAYIPFAALPQPMGDLLWRALSFGLLAVGAYRFFHLASQRSELFHLSAGFLTLLLCADSFRNGQATVLMTGTMLLAVDALARSRWNLATLCLVGGFAIKPLSIVLILLVAALHRNMFWRLGLAALVLPLIPYAFQSAEYVTWQYEQFAVMLWHANRLGSETAWAQLFGMLEVFGLETPARLQTVLRVIAALATLATCYFAQRHLTTQRFAIYLYTLTAIYLMLFNPRTENCTYCILGPAIGMFYAEAFVARRWMSAGFLLTLGILAFGNYELGKPLTPEGSQPVWLAPLACSFFAFYVFYQLAHETAGAGPSAMQSPDLSVNEEEPAIARAA